MGAIPAFVKKEIEEQNVAAAQADHGDQQQPEEKKHKRNYEIVDEQALYAFNPNLFKLVPNYKSITQAIKLGFALPGIAFHNDTQIQNEGDENAA